MEIRITVVNGGHNFILIPGLLPPESEFPSTWCWGPNVPFVPTALLRNIALEYGRRPAGSEMRSGAMPGQRYTLSLPLNLSHIFDLSVPGKYEAQLAGLGMVSNVIKFRVLPPNNKPPGPAIACYDGKAPRFTMVWGAIRHGLQMGTYVKFNPNGSQEVHVHLFFRNVDRDARTIRLTGNPEVDLAHCRMVGPCFGNGVRLGSLYRRINNRAVPMTAYGKRMAKENPTGGHRRVYTLGAGKLYEYWRPLLLNRRYDLSIPGPYKFSTRLTGTHLRSGTISIYVGVQPRAYNMPLFNRWLTAWKKKHGVK